VSRYASDRDLPEGDLISHEGVDYPLLGSNRHTANTLDDPRKQFIGRISIRNQEREDGLWNEIPTLDGKRPGVQLNPLVGEARLLPIDDQTESGRNFLPKGKEVTRSAKGTIVSVKDSDSSLTHAQNDIAGDIEAGLIQETQQWKTDQVTHHAAPPNRFQ
jgi:hypothetical protein